MENVLAVSYHDHTDTSRERDAVFNVPTATVSFRAWWLSEADHQFRCVHVFPIVLSELLP